MLGPSGPVTGIGREKKQIRYVSDINWYPMSTLFPSHFYVEAKHDSCSILGNVPIYCYSRDTHPIGFSSQLERGRALLIEEETPSEGQRMVSGTRSLGSLGACLGESLERKC